MGLLSRRLLFSLLGIILLSASAVADGSHERTQFGHDITIGPNEKATDVTCFGCSVRVRGKVLSEITTFGGSIVVEQDGQVDGDATAFGGDIRLEGGSTVNSLNVFGGKLRRDPSASVNGDITDFSGSYWLLLIFGLPFLILGAFITLIVWLVRRLLRPAIPIPV